MSVQATYALQLDYDNDGSFATAGDDISSAMMRATIMRGFSGPLARVAPVGRMRVLLKNADKAFSPPLDADLLPGKPVRLRMTYDATTVTLFQGKVEAIRPTAGEYGPRTTVLECVDSMDLLDRFEGRIALQVNAYADDIISDIVDDVFTPAGTNYESGVNQFPTSGERWSINPALARFGMLANQEEIYASQKILDCCIADWGRFFVAKDGTPTYYNRHHMPLDTSTALTLSGDMVDMLYEKRSMDVLNWVDVTYLPRTVGQFNEVIGRFAPERAARIEPTETDTFTIRFRDPSNPALDIGAINVITPVSGTDYEATDFEDGGDDVSANLNITFTAYADRAEVEIENTHASTPAYIQFFQVRGGAVRSRESETVRASDSTSIAAHGQRKLPLSAPLMGNNQQAQNLADYLLDYYKDPLDTVEGVVIVGNRSATLIEAVRDLELMDRVVITEDQTGLSSYAGYVTRMRHEINSKFDHRLYFDLETAYTLGGTPFELGDTLNSGNILIY